MSRQTLADFTGTTPEFRLEQFFAGRVVADGLMEDRFGRVRRQFAATIEGTFDGATLTLDEDFRYTDGEAERRHWEIRREGERGYVGTAKGVIGEARGAVNGQAFHWRYSYKFSYRGRTLKVRFDDWMFLQHNGVVINRARVKKLGLTLGTVWLFFRKVT
ncbi:MAG: DUF3833 domain-containing protein [Alphaproteobacteria bacterium]|nr:DUF3833 domain-containing protein [Alphaproteobacteria bacterium]